MPNTARSCTQSIWRAIGSRRSLPNRVGCSMPPAVRATEPSLGRGGAKSVVGIDFDDATVAHARCRYPAADFVHGDVRRLPVRGRGVRSRRLLRDDRARRRSSGRRWTSFGRVLAGGGAATDLHSEQAQLSRRERVPRARVQHEEFVELLSSPLFERRATAPAQLACLERASRRRSRGDVWQETPATARFGSSRASSLVRSSIRWPCAETAGLHPSVPWWSPPDSTRLTLARVGSSTPRDRRDMARRVSRRPRLRPMRLAR